jgi:heme A synthase
MRSKNSTGVAIATAAAMLFGTAFVGTAVAGTDATVHCTGVNSCKGQSACKSASNACKGQNSCKGQGFLEMTKKECTAAHAKMKAEAKKPS